MLLTFQQSTIDWMNARRSGLILNEAGLGKTLTVLKYLEGVYKLNPNSKTLIVCPTGVMSIWASEIEKFQIALPVPIFYHGSNRDRVSDNGATHGSNRDRVSDNVSNNGNNPAPQFIITSYGTLSHSTVNSTDNSEVISLRKTISGKFDTVILDEAHYLRNHSTLAAKCALQLRSNHYYLLTATPILNKPLDAYVYFKLTGLANVDSLKEFKDTYTRQTTASVTALRELLAKNSIRYRKSNVLQELPPRKDTTVVIHQTPEEVEMYKALHSYSYLRIMKLARKYRRANTDSKRLFGMMILTLILRLKQCATSPYLAIVGMKRMKSLGISTTSEALGQLNFYNNSLTDADTECPVCYDNTANTIAECGHKCCDSCWKALERIGNYNCPVCREFVDYTDLKSVASATPVTQQSCKKDFESSKTRWIQQKVEELLSKGEKVVITSQWTQSLNLIIKILEERGVLKPQDYIYLRGGLSNGKKARLIESFQTNPDVKVCFLSMLSSAEGITLTASSNLIKVDNWWNKGKEEQVKERIHRIGQTKQVYIYNLQVSDTIEERIEDLTTKKKVIADVITGDIPIEITQGDDSWIKRVVKLIDRPSI